MNEQFKEASSQSVIAHPDDEAVDRFAHALKQKLALAREKGRGGWQQMDPEELSIMLREHVEKGDPLDVASNCMFLWHHGVGIAKPSEHAQPVESELEDWHDKIIGMEVSMDVSTGEDDAYHRVFGRVCEVMLKSGGAENDSILAIEDGRNF